MPKTRESNLTKIKRYANQSGGILTIQSDNKTGSHVLYCQCCLSVVSFDRKCHVDQHLRSKNHESKAKGFHGRQISVQNLFDGNQTEFNMDLTEFLVHMNIPFDRISRPEAKRFFDKYLNKYKLPEESTLRKGYLKPLYLKTIEKIREEIKDNYIWIQTDESTDKQNRKVVNIIVGIMDENSNNCTKYLLDVAFVKKANHTTVVQCVNKALAILWPNGILFDRVLVLITDAAPYMKKVGEVLMLTFENMTHITCVNHGLHNLCEYLMVCYKDVNRLISCAKKVFLKAPNRVELFHNTCPNTPLPPEPVKTRWGSWLKGVEYQAKHFSQFCSVIELLDPEESIHIEEAQQLIKSPNIKNEISFIYANFNCIQTAITRLESNNLSLSESFATLDSVIIQLNANLNESAKKIKEKLNNIFEKNKGLKRIRAINDILNGQLNLKLDIDLNPFAIASFKWCPITDCDIERSFSIYKWILSDRRLGFAEENLKYYVIVHSNSQ